jgi:hypothetical protein
MHDGEGEAAVDAPFIDEDSTGAALALVATLFASGKVQVFAQCVE